MIDDYLRVKKLTDEHGFDYYVLHFFGKITQPLAVLTEDQATFLKKEINDKMKGI